MDGSFLLNALHLFGFLYPSFIWLHRHCMVLIDVQDKYIKLIKTIHLIH
jgi:hypothetical protein